MSASAAGRRSAKFVSFMVATDGEVGANNFHIAYLMLYAVERMSSITLLCQLPRKYTPIKKRYYCAVVLVVRVARKGVRRIVVRRGRVLYQARQY